MKEKEKRKKTKRKKKEEKERHFYACRRPATPHHWSTNSCSSHLAPEKLGVSNNRWTLAMAFWSSLF